MLVRSRQCSATCKGDRRTLPARGVRLAVILVWPRMMRACAANERLHPSPRDPVVPGDLPLGPAVNDHGRDHNPSHRHRTTPWHQGCERCCETPANYVLMSDTFVSTR